LVLVELVELRLDHLLLGMVKILYLALLHQRVAAVVLAMLWLVALLVVLAVVEGQLMVSHKVQEVLVIHPLHHHPKVIMVETD
jgi:hypothetical protein